MALLTLTQALEKISACLTPSTETELVSLAHAVNRICAEPIYSPINVPAFDNSAMDGYAVRFDDLTRFSQFDIVGKAFAGNAFEGDMQAGQCVRIMTGAKIPTNADAVIMQEEAVLNADGTVSFNSNVSVGANIRRIGEDIQQGELVLEQGSKLNVTSLPLLASLGIAEIKVFKPLKVAILSTGDELVPVGQPLKAGQIYDSNRFALRLMLEKLHLNIMDYGILPDDPHLFERTFTEAAQTADVIITSGGVSVGEADFTKTVLEKLGNIGFWKIAMKPGKPFAFGQIGKAHFFGLPGNPVSALVTFYQLVQPALLTLAGVNAKKVADFSPYLTACTTVALKKVVGRQDFQRGFYRLNQSGQLEVTPVGVQGSHIFSAFHQSNCFIVLAQEQGNVAAGEQVMIQPFNALLS
ncbi:molybdopterin molybdotransferase MoeA [Muribacter muris]|uniref:Molybdopterin molybdenumtransferase n=1 Tax=Muribacter muris TaxID=67855 RepID=A0A4Y9K8Q6_9PAST|nr:molybdopterin molybdotransferase MoeA [Muribacter muris]MBF0784277.1 molybdopterin molybdotransferase MoeA [Muribacter muris]MBF0826985.1 molybdopterin molybdotransferase MoeA [Muribacter muris]TFV13016.1 molybdopterin molybdotransferase MoeA [Muribacter muris]